MNPIDRVSLHPPRADTEIHRMISKESECHLVEINWHRTFPKIDSKGRTSVEPLILSMVGLTLK